MERRNKTSWYAGEKDKERIKEIDAIILAAAPFIDLLLKQLHNKAEAADSTAQSKSLYDNPNWAHRQADLIGYKRALSEIEKLIKKESE
jgi:hypothetical protein